MLRRCSDMSGALGESRSRVERASWCALVPSEPKWFPNLTSCHDFVAIIPSDLQRSEDDIHRDSLVTRMTVVQDVKSTLGIGQSSNTGLFENAVEYRGY